MIDAPSSENNHSHRESERYQKLQQEYTDLLRTISHDLTTPLRQIKIFLQMLMKDMEPDLEPYQKSYRDFITQSIDDMSRDLDILTDYAAIQSADIIREPHALSEILDKVSKALQTQIDESRAQIKTGTPPVIYGKKRLLQQMLYHLIDNSLKYRAPDRAPLIDIQTAQDDSFTKIIITDNGRGIDPHILPSAFYLFGPAQYTEKDEDAPSPRRRLGLPFSYKIVEAHGGSLQIEPRSAHGTRAIIILPNKQP